MWGNRPQKPSAGFVQAPQAVKADKVDGPVVKTQIKIVPVERVTETYREFVGPPNTVVIDTAKVPAAPNGAVTVTSLDPNTGIATTQVKVSEAPWIAFERNNTIGAGYEIGMQGNKVPIYYRRDVLRIKDIHLTAEAGAKIALDPREKSEAHAGALVEYRW